jgi:hypothetical protein
MAPQSGGDIVWEGGGVKRRFVEVRPGEYAPEVALFPGAVPADASTTSLTPAIPVDDPLLSALKAGRMYIAGKAISIPGTGQPSDRCALRVENPGTSGVLLTVLAFTVYSSIGQQVRYRSGGTVSPANALTPRSLNLAVPNVPAKGTVQWSNVAASGGTFWDSESRVDPAAPLQLEFPRGLILGPGNALTLDTGSTGPQTTTVNVYWIETDPPA